MRAAIYGGPRSIELGERPDPVIQEASDAIVRVVLGSVCGSDLWYYRGESPHAPGPIGHELIGVVEETGNAVRDIQKGDFVIAPLRSTTTLDHIREAYDAMDQRRATKSLLRIGTR